MKAYKDLESYNIDIDNMNNKKMEIISNISIPCCYDVNFDDLNLILNKAYEIRKESTDIWKKSYYALDYDFLVVLVSLAFKYGYIRGYEHGITFDKKPVKDESTTSLIDIYKELEKMRSINKHWLFYRS